MMLLACMLAMMMVAASPAIAQTQLQSSAALAPGAPPPPAYEVKPNGNLVFDGDQVLAGSYSGASGCEVFATEIEQGKNYRQLSQAQIQDILAQCEQQGFLEPEMGTLPDQRCTEILNSLQAVPQNADGRIFIDEDFGAAIAQREGVSAQAVQSCEARYNAGSLPAANPGNVSKLPDTGGPPLKVLALGGSVLLVGGGLLLKKRLN